LCVDIHEAWKLDEHASLAYTYTPRRPQSFVIIIIIALVENESENSVYFETRVLYINKPIRWVFIAKQLNPQLGILAIDVI